MQWVTGAISPEVERPGCEADHSPPSSVEIKNGEALPPLPHMSSWHSAQLIKGQDKFTHTFIFTSYAEVACETAVH
jgi:hypothetical protein